MVLKTRLLQGQVQEVIYKTKEISKSKMLLILSSLIGLGVLGRVVFQWVPSVEPIVPLAVGLAFFHDWKKASVLGVSAFFVSNFFVWGFQGPWTVFQCLGAGVAALFGGLFSKISKGEKSFFLSLVVGTIFYEIIVNIGSFVFFPWALLIGIPYILAALPFGAIHIASSIGFGSIVYAFRDNLQNVWTEEVFSVRYSTDSDSNSDSQYKLTKRIRKWGNKYTVDYRLWPKRDSGSRESR